MKISIIGGGAMGSIYAAFMAKTHHNIFMVDSWKDHIEEIKTTGLRIQGASGDRVIHNINVSTDINITKNSNLYIISTKAAHVELVASQLQEFIQDDDIVLTIQNGMGSSDSIAKYINPKNILIGVAEGFGASVIAPGSVHHNAMNLIRIGETVSYTHLTLPTKRIV